MSCGLSYSCREYLIKQMERRFNKTERWGMWLFGLFIAGWLGLSAYLSLIGDTKVSLRENDLRRILNSEIYSSQENIHLPESVDKVRIESVDSISADGYLHYQFSFRVKSKENGKSWHRGTVAEKNLVFKDLTYTMAE